MSLALPGVVKDNKASLAILPWSISKQVLRDQFGVEQVHFMNDFQASALGIPHLKQEDLIRLNQRKHKRDATRVAVGSGTGQGVSWMLYDGFATRACSTEGGHVDFAPVDETRIDLLSFFSSVMVRVI